MKNCSARARKYGGRCYAFQPIPRSSRVGKNEKTALIASDFKDIENIDVAVFKPDDYKAEPPESFMRGGFEKFIYYPAFASEADLKAVERLLKRRVRTGFMPKITAEYLLPRIKT